jgi:TPR repeat protein
MSIESDEQLAVRAMEKRAYEEAVGLLRPLAERNSEYALLCLGWICETGAAGASDVEAARAYYEAAASQGSASAHVYLVKLLLRNGQPEEARAAAERLAQAMTNGQANSGD